MVDLIGKRIKKLRIERNFTQQDLAHQINVSKNTISLYETGKKYPSLITLCKIAAIFNVTTDYLLGLSNALGTEYAALDDIQLEILRNLVSQFEQMNQMKNEI